MHVHSKVSFFLFGALHTIDPLILYLPTQDKSINNLQVYSVLCSYIQKHQDKDTENGSQYLCCIAKQNSLPFSGAGS